MLRDLSSAQLSGWIAYAQLEPVGNPVEMESPKQKVKRIKKSVGGFLRSMVDKNGG